MIKQINYIDTLPIRQKVLWPNMSLLELQVPGDETAIHLGYYQDDKLIGVISGYINDPSAQFRKFAFLKEYQGKGYGTSLLLELLSIFKNRNVSYVWCNARTSASTFYEKFGFTVKENSSFYKEDIPYVIMHKKGH